MDIYHVWCDLKPGVSDTEFAANTSEFLGHLRAQGKIGGFRLTRRKLGLGPSDLGDFHIMIETEDLAQLDAAFKHVATRSGEVEKAHFSVNSMASKVRFALYRDFPDIVRKTGGEKF
ncbi:MAG: hypothetical protein Q7N95_00125 [Alphaproteobacteria bacterium]|nr:hypothetical protein [Alphaproteobacteria bacterium]